MTGRPRLKPTAPQRNRVKLMKAAGWSNERISAQMEICRNTLEDRFAAELQHGADLKRLEVMEHLDKASKKGNASASKQLLEIMSAAPSTPKPEGESDGLVNLKLGKKEALQRQAENPDTSSEMGEMMARRMQQVRQLN